jgi:hypothetical protein
MAHVQHTRYIGRGYHYCKWGAAIGLTVKITFAKPMFIPFAFYCCRLKILRQFHFYLFLIIVEGKTTKKRGGILPELGSRKPGLINIYA